MTRRINHYRCSRCGCDEPILNAIDGKLYCNNCGIILEDSSRKAEKEHGHTADSASEKDSAVATQEEPVLPIPCTKGFEEWTVKQWFAKINEELDEMKNAVLVPVGLDWRPDSERFAGTCAMEIACEATDTITAITSMLEAMGIDEQQRQEAQRRVNGHNRERNRI